VGSLALTLKRFFYRLAVILSWYNAHFGKTDTAIYKDRFASDHEFTDLTTVNLPPDSLLLGVNHFSRILHVKSTKERPQLGNILIEAPTGGGKGLLAVSQLLAWQESAVVFDINTHSAPPWNLLILF
jgi:hypothetical protein